MRTEMVAITNLYHEYSHVTPSAALQSGYSKSDKMLGTTIFDLKAPVVEIANFVHGLNLRVLESKKPIFLFDIGVYGGGLACCFTAKELYFSPDSYLVSGILTKATLLDKGALTPFIFDLYKSIVRLNRADKFGGVAYEIVENYSELGLTNVESRVMFLLAHGKTAAKIAELSHRSMKTVEGHIEKIKNKLGVNRKEQLVEYMIYTNLIHRIPSSIVSNNKTGMFNRC